MGNLFASFAFHRFDHFVPVRFAVEDAERVARPFLELGYTRGPSWTDEQFGYARNETLHVQRELERLLTPFSAQGGGRFILYVASHGATGPDGAPVFFKPWARPEDIHDPRADSYVHVPNDILKVCARFDNVQALVVLDTCRTQADLPPTDPIHSRDFGPVMTRKAWKGGTILFATEPRSQSFAVEAAGGSQFALAAEAALKPFVEQPRPLQAHTLRDLVAVNMTQLAADHGTDGVLVAQRPELCGEEELALLDSDDCHRIQADRHDRELVEQARMLGTREAWLMAQRALWGGSDPELRSEIEANLTLVKEQELPESVAVPSELGGILDDRSIDAEGDSLPKDILLATQGNLEAPAKGSTVKDKSEAVRVRFAIASYWTVVVIGAVLIGKPDSFFRSLIIFILATSAGIATYVLKGKRKQ